MLHFGDITWQPGSALRIDPFHGWCARKSMDSVTEMEVRSPGRGFFDRANACGDHNWCGRCGTWTMYLSRFVWYSCNAWVKILELWPCEFWRTHVDYRLQRFREKRAKSRWDIPIRFDMILFRCGCTMSWQPLHDEEKWHRRMWTFSTLFACAAFLKPLSRLGKRTVAACETVQYWPVTLRLFPWERSLPLSSSAPPRFVGIIIIFFQQGTLLFSSSPRGCLSNQWDWRYIDIHKDTLEEEDEEVEKTALEDGAGISDASLKVDLHLRRLAL